MPTPSTTAGPRGRLGSVGSDVLGFGIPGPSSSPRTGQISSASKRDSSRERLGAGSVRGLDRDPAVMPTVVFVVFALPLLAARAAVTGGRAEVGAMGF